jgi:hypothetical protein
MPTPPVIPPEIANAMAQNQPLVDSAERSQYSETRERWAYSPGAIAERNPAAMQAMSFGIKSAMAFGVYKYAPGVVQGIHDSMGGSSSVHSWQMGGSYNNVKTVGDVFKLDTGKEALKSIRAFTFNGAKGGISDLDFSSNANFWYSGLKKVEQSGLELPIFDNVIKLFTKATYMSDVLSYSVKRQGTTTLNISMMSLGAASRDRTLDLYARQFHNMADFATDADYHGAVSNSKKKLELLDYLIFDNGSVYAGDVTRSGEVVRRSGQAAVGHNVRLADKGKLTEALLGIINPSLGMKDPLTGGTFAEKIGGNEGYVLLSSKHMDENLSRLMNRAAKLPGLSAILNTPERIQKAANGVLLSEAYTSMAVQRTSNLVTEMVNEVGNFLEYISPETKKLVYSGLHKSKLMPKLQHGHAFAMLARYSTYASAVGLGLAAVNQVGYSMQNGSALTSFGAGAIQTGALTLAGAAIGKKFFKNSLGGAIAGGVTGALGMMGVGPFAGGTIPGVANLFARANELRSYVGEATLINSWRRKVEEVMPGSTKATTALGIGVLAATGYVTASRFLNKGKLVEEHHRIAYLKERFGDRPDISLKEVTQQVSADMRQIQNLKDNFIKSKPSMSPAAMEAAERQLESQVAAVRTRVPSPRPSKMTKMSEKQLSRVEEEMVSYAAKLAKEGEYGILENKIGQGGDKSNFLALAEKVTDFSYERERQRIIASTKGDSIKGVGKRLMQAVKFAPRAKAILYGAAAVSSLWYAATGGLGTTERPSELRELNQGKRLEAVRRNQKWEMGQGAYEGDDVLFYRPTLTARLSSGATQAGASGNHGQLEELFLKNFTYKLERENYYKRPAPITGAAFEEIPFIQPFIRPIADLIKAPKLMHVGEWSKTDRDGKSVFLERSSGLEEIPEERLGGLGMLAPDSPYSSGRVFGEFWKQTTALSGLVGFMGRSLKGALTGSEGFSDQRGELESFGQNTDLASRFYDLQGGGSFLNVPFTSEVIRRFLHKPDVEQYNPIKNDMPSWMPDNFKYGNPYVSLRHGGGEYRMPGEGYQALHKELKGTNPEDYSLMHKLSILGDIAPYSSEYRTARRETELMKAEGDMTVNERKFFYRHQQQMEERTQRRQYDNYQFKPSTYDSIGGKVTSVDKESMSFTVEGYGGRFGVAGIRNDVDALISDFNLSVKEAAKLRDRNKEAFSSKISVGNTVSVTMPASIGHAVDDQGIIQAAVTNNGFNVNKDIREEGRFAKAESAIENYAMTGAAERGVGRLWEGAMHFANKMAQPIEHVMMFGAAPINKLLPYRDALEDYEAREVYGTEMKGWDSPIDDWIAPAIKSAMHNYLGLDFESSGLKKKRETEEYFDKLKYYKYNMLSQGAEAAGEGFLADQYQRIAGRTAIGQTGFVSDSELGNALGGREAMFASGFANEINVGRQEEIMEALPDFKQHIMKNFYLNKDLGALNRAATAGGMSTTAMDYAATLLDYKGNQGFSSDREVSSYDAEQARASEVSQYFSNKTLPRVDWIGFNPAVDLEDVKLKYIENEGMDYHDFGIFPSRSNYITRKPYLDQADVGALNNHTFTNPIEGMANVAKAYGGYGVNSYNIQGPNRSQSFVSLTSNQNVYINPFE